MRSKQVVTHVTYVTRGKKNTFGSLYNFLILGF